jgi:TusE/DsrC/DsvC family sulfur relay protein
MPTFTTKNKDYEVDENGFLVDFEQWDEDFARALSSDLGIKGGLTDEHLRVIRFIRKSYLEDGRCPLVYKTCKANRLTLKRLEKLFPTGYLRGACRLSGINYIPGYLGAPRVTEQPRPRIATPSSAAVPESGTPTEERARKTYTIDGYGFLQDAEQWDEQYATLRAFEMKIGPLTDARWRILYYLRDRYHQTGLVPTVIETCRDNGIDLEDLEMLFPDGYQRGAVKLAGLRVF